MPVNRRATKTRKKAEFDLLRLISRLESLRVTAGAYSWSLPEIQAARDMQMAGKFRLPARLAESFSTDDAMFNARRTRLAPQRSIPVKLVPPRESAEALRVLGEADALYGPKGVGVSPDTMVTINSHLADHGVAFGFNLPNVRPDGSRIDLEHHAWPIEWVEWDSTQRCFTTQVDPACMPREEAGRRVPIIHGDGRWTIYAAEEIEPWKKGCLLPGALVWARHAFGFAHWFQSSAAHGNPKLVGELPPNVKTKSEDGDDFLALLVALASADMPVGIKPNGSAVEYVTNSSRAWEIFKELVESAKASAQQIYNGHDGTLGTNANAPGVDLTALIRVMSDIAEGDLHTIERCFKSGCIDVWSALNFGTSDLAPERLYQIPDADQDDRRARAGERRIAFYDAIDRERALGFDVDEQRIAVLADEYDVSIGDLAAAAGATTAAAQPAPAGPAPTATPTNGAAGRGVRATPPSPPPPT